MKLNKPVNSNYCGTIVKIKNVLPLEKCDNICGTIIFGDHIIVSKDTQVGQIGIYFPAETQLSYAFANVNNLHRHAELNADSEKVGYLDDSRRIRTMKMRGNKSSGLFMPLESLSFCCNVNDLKEGDTFDEINGVQICCKYFIVKKQPNENSGKKIKKVKKVSRLIEKQFRFHDDTAQLGKNIDRVQENDIISITYKLHGTSGISSKVLCKKPLSRWQRFLRFLGADIREREHFNLWSSRKVVKNDDMNIDQVVNHFYKVDIWGLANGRIAPLLANGMTAYYEIVGFLPDSSAIQKMKKAYDYGCANGEFEIYIYRLTYTSPDGNVFEFSAKMVQDWCKLMNVKAVPELYYGKVKDLFYYNQLQIDEDFHTKLLELLTEKYLEKNCHMCKNKVPAEGIVLRREVIGLEAYKLKSFIFKNAETKQLDKGESNIEDEN